MRSKASEFLTAVPVPQGVEHARLDGPGAGPQRRVVGKQGPPAQEDLAFLGDDFLEDLHAERLLGRVRRGEERSHAVSPGLSQRDPHGLQRWLKSSWGIWIKTPHRRRCCSRSRRRRDDPGSPAPQAVPNQLMRFPPFQVDDESHAATVVFVTRVVKTLG